MAWYYQATPHDTHDWDAAQTPVMIDGVIDGKPRKLLAQANRNGHFFLLDRTNGKHILTAPFIDSINWTKEINKKGQPVGNPRRRPASRAPSSPHHRRGDELAAPELQPGHGPLLRGHHPRRQHVLPDRHRPTPAGLGRRRAARGQLGTELKAIDYKTGKIVWSRPLAMSVWGPGADRWASSAPRASSSSATTAAATSWPTTRPRQAAVARRARATTRPNGPQTFLLDGRQYVVVGAGDQLFAFTLQQ
jgi:alcohol dehydrogenase (cytochrome c)